jgi:hypothetical protein
MGHHPEVSPTTKPWALIKYALPMQIGLDEPE